MNHSIYGFIDGPIPAEDKDQIGPGIDAFSRDASRIAWACRRSELRGDTGSLQSSSSALKDALWISPEFAGRGIIDQNRLPIRCDASSITRRVVPNPSITGGANCVLH
jgi:hypothetical protein